MSTEDRPPRRRPRQTHVRPLPLDSKTLFTLHNFQNDVRFTFSIAASKTIGAQAIVAAGPGLKFNGGSFVHMMTPAQTPNWNLQTIAKAAMALGLVPKFTLTDPVSGVTYDASLIHPETAK